MRKKVTTGTILHSTLTVSRTFESYHGNQKSMDATSNHTSPRTTTLKERGSFWRLSSIFLQLSIARTCERVTASSRAVDGVAKRFGNTVLLLSLVTLHQKKQESPPLLVLTWVCNQPCVSVKSPVSYSSFSDSIAVAFGLPRSSSGLPPSYLARQSRTRIFWCPSNLAPKDGRQNPAKPPILEEESSQGPQLKPCPPLPLPRLIPPPRRRKISVSRHDWRKKWIY